MGEFVLVTAIKAGAVKVAPSFARAVELFRQRRRNERRRRLEAELAATRAELWAALAQSRSGLNGQAHEARKALITEAYRFSQRRSQTLTEGDR